MSLASLWSKYAKKFPTSLSTFFPWKIKKGLFYLNETKSYLVEVEVAVVEMALLFEEVSLIPVGQVQSSR